MEGSTATGSASDGNHVQVASHAATRAPRRGSPLPYSACAYAAPARETTCKSTAASNSHPIRLRGRAHATTKPASSTTARDNNQESGTSTSTDGFDASTPAAAPQATVVTATAAAV